jgi:hypothetical protein
MQSIRFFFTNCFVSLFFYDLFNERQSTINYFENQLLIVKNSVSVFFSSAFFTRDVGFFKIIVTLAKKQDASQKVKVPLMWLQQSDRSKDRIYLL